jgi:hypothetical protein
MWDAGNPEQKTISGVPAKPAKALNGLSFARVQK